MKIHFIKRRFGAFAGTSRCGNSGTLTDSSAAVTCRTCRRLIANDQQAAARRRDDVGKALIASRRDARRAAFARALTGAA